MTRTDSSLRDTDKFSAVAGRALRRSVRLDTVVPTVNFVVRYNVFRNVNVLRRVPLSGSGMTRMCGTGRIPKRKP